MGSEMCIRDRAKGAGLSFGTRDRKRYTLTEVGKGASYRTPSASKIIHGSFLELFKTHTPNKDVGALIKLPRPEPSEFGQNSLGGYCLTQRREGATFITCALRSSRLCVRTLLFRRRRTLDESSNERLAPRHHGST